MKSLGEVMKHWKCWLAIMCLGALLITLIICVGCTLSRRIA